jgi:hypothetical protein
MTGARRSRAALAMALVAACPLAAGCESTQDKSARLAKHGSAAFKEKGLTVKRKSAVVKVLSTSLLHDQNGTAVVVAVRNTSDKPLMDVPIAINVKDAHGKSVFKNDAPGIQPSLAGIRVMRPHEEVLWVHDQVLATGPAKRVAVKVGVDKGPPPSIPKIAFDGTPKLEVDPTSGVNAFGFMKNLSKVDQRRVIVWCVARKGDKVIAAGRAGIQKMRAGRRARFHVYFIGDPHGGKLTLTAPPTILEQGA